MNDRSARGTDDLRPEPSQPHNALAEQAVLTAMLADNTVFQRFAGSLRPEDFYDPLHADIYRAVAELIEAGQYADGVTLVRAIRDKRAGDQDAEDYVAGLATEKSASFQQLGSYVHEITHLAAARDVAAALTAGAKRAADHQVTPAGLAAIGGDVEAQVDAALLRTSVRESTLRPAHEFAAAARERYASGLAGTLTHIDVIDDLTGGLFSDELSIVAGRPSMGKTALASQIGLNVARSGKGVLFISLEMGGVPVAQRLLSTLAYRGEDRCIHYRKYRSRTLSDDDQRILQECEERLRLWPLFIEEQGALTMAQINATARRCAGELAKAGKQLSLVVVDYLGLVTSSNRYHGNRVYEIGETSAGLKALAKAMGMHVMALHQVNREVERTDDARPQLHHLRDSGNLEQDADVVMLVFREQHYLERRDDSEAKLKEARNKMEVTVAKQRQGPVGSVTAFCSMANNVVQDLDPHEPR